MNKTNIKIHTKSMITVLVVCILLFKIDIKLLATTNNDYIVLRVDIFKNVKLLYVKLLLFDGNLYYKINNRIYKLVNLKSNAKITKIPKLKLHSLSVYTTLNNDDYITLLGGYGVISVLLSLLPTIIKNRLSITHYHTLTVPIFGKGDNSLQINAKIGFGIVKFGIELLINSIIRRENNGNTRVARQNN